MRYGAGRRLLGLCLILGAVAVADTQVLVYKVRQKALLNTVRASSSTCWPSGVMAAAVTGASPCTP